MTKRQQRARAATLLAASLPHAQVAKDAGVPVALIRRWLKQPKFKDEVMAHYVGHLSVLEATRNTARMAQGKLPIPLVMQEDFDGEDEEETPENPPDYRLIVA